MTRLLRFREQIAAHRRELACFALVVLSTFLFSCSGARSFDRNQAVISQGDKELAQYLGKLPNHVYYAFPLDRELKSLGGAAELLLESHFNELGLEDLNVERNYLDLMRRLAVSDRVRQKITARFVELVDSHSDSISSWAFDSLLKMEPENLKLLMLGLRNDSDSIRAKAIQHICARLTPANCSLLIELASLLRPTGQLSEQAEFFLALRRYPTVISRCKMHLFDLLERSPKVHFRAYASALVGILPDEELMPILARHLKLGDPLRIDAGRVMLLLQMPLDAVLDQVRIASVDHSRGVAVLGTLLLGKMEHLRPSDRQFLENCLRDKNDSTRFAAALALRAKEKMLGAANEVIGDVFSADLIPCRWEEIGAFGQALSPAFHKIFRVNAPRAQLLRLCLVHCLIRQGAEFPDEVLSCGELRVAVVDYYGVGGAYDDALQQVLDRPDRIGFLETLRWLRKRWDISVLSDRLPQLERFPSDPYPRTVLVRAFLWCGRSATPQMLEVIADQKIERIFVELVGELDEEAVLPDSIKERFLRRFQEMGLPKGARMMWALARLTAIRSDVIDDVRAQVSADKELHRYFGAHFWLSARFAQLNSYGVEAFIREYAISGSSGLREFEPILDRSIDYIYPRLIQLILGALPSIRSEMSSRVAQRFSDDELGPLPVTAKHANGTLLRERALCQILRHLRRVDEDIGYILPVVSAIAVSGNFDDWIVLCAKHTEFVLKKKLRAM